MKYLIAIAVVVVTVLLATAAQAQVYVPGGAPLCFPQTVATPGGLVTIIVCQ